MLKKNATLICLGQSGFFFRWQEMRIQGKLLMLMVIYWSPSSRSWTVRTSSSKVGLSSAFWRCNKETMAFQEVQSCDFKQTKRTSSHKMTTDLVPAAGHDGVDLLIGQLGAVEAPTNGHCIHNFLVVEAFVWKLSQSVHLPHKDPWAFIWLVNIWWHS